MRKPAVAGSFRPAATFRNALLLARHGERSSAVIRNLLLVESDGGSHRRRLFRDRAELAAGVELHFGIARSLVAEVLEDLPVLVDP